MPPGAASGTPQLLIVTDRQCNRRQPEFRRERSSRSACT
jgi:hypothetical protein